MTTLVPRKYEIGTGYRIIIFLLTTVSVRLFTDDTFTPSLSVRFLTVTTEGLTEVTRKVGSDHWKVQYCKFGKSCLRGTYGDHVSQLENSVRYGFYNTICTCTVFVVRKSSLDSRETSRARNYNPCRRVHCYCCFLNFMRVSETLESSEWGNISFGVSRGLRITIPG